MPRQRTAAEPTAHVSRRILVNVKRGPTTNTPRVVWQHEMPILEAIFGEGNVTEVPAEVLDEGYKAKAVTAMLPHNKKQDDYKRPSRALCLGWCFVDDPKAEYVRLEEAYGMEGESRVSFVEKTFGRFNTGAFEKVIGACALEDLPEDQLRSLLLANGYQLPIVNWESSEHERKAYAQATDEFNTADKAKLLKLAEEVGVEIA